MYSTPVKVIENLFPGPAADVASSTLSQPTALPVTSVAILTMGSACATTVHPLAGKTPLGHPRTGADGI